MQKAFCLLCFFIFSNIHAATTVIHDANGYGFNQQRELVAFSVLAFDDATGQILARGDSSLLQHYPHAKKINFKGKTLLPGLIDGHGHILGLGQILDQVDLRNSASQQEAVAKTAAFSKLNSSVNWITGRGWNQELWPEKQFPTKDLLDEAFPNKPVYLKRVDGHAGWANSQALKLAGINRETLNPDGGEIIRDNQGNPTGVLIDNAMNLIEQHIPQANETDKIRALNAAFTHLLSLGITSVHDAGVDTATALLYQQLRANKQLPLRVYVMLLAHDEELQNWLDKGIIDDTEDFLDIRAVKIFGDGALGSRGAALLAPYSDSPSQKGLLVTAQDALTHIMQRTINAGFQTNVHAIGDLTNRLVLDRFEQLVPKNLRKSSRHRIEHAQVVSPIDFPRFATLHILPAMQAIHATSDKNMAADRLGLARLRGAYAWQSFIKQGSIIIGGSDFPVELAEPFHGIHAAVTRQSQDNQPQGGWLPNERLTLTQALRSFTIDAAYGAFQEDSMGTLDVGAWADFIVIDNDIFNIAPELIWQIEVEQTFINGKQVYQK